MIERHWLVSWDLPPGRTHEVTLLPHPCVNLVFDEGVVAIAGVGRERFTYPYVGSGRVFGIKFRPGAFRPLLGDSVAQLTGQLRPLATLWGAADAARFAEDLASAPGLDELVAVAERHLRAHLAASRSGGGRGRPDRERAALRPDDHARRRCGQPVRYPGAQPAAALRALCRGQPEMGAAPLPGARGGRRLAEGTSGTWAEVAVELGYFDQPREAT